jgi:uncharacterized protein
MAVFAVTYQYVDDAELLATHRPVHREYLRSLLGERGLIAAGPTVGGPSASAFLVFEAESAGDVEALLDHDPFWTEGVITAREVIEWNVVIGSLGAGDGR